METIVHCPGKRRYTASLADRPVYRRTNRSQKRQAADAKLRPLNAPCLRSLLLIVDDLLALPPFLILFQLLRSSLSSSSKL